MIQQRDQAALEAAMIAARAESPGRAQQLDAKLKNESWFEVASFAAVCAQSLALRLKPWMAAPVDSDDEIDPQGRYGGRPAEVALKRKMIALGISIFEPDPLAAISANR
jgi:hypothetical protein